MHSNRQVRRPAGPSSSSSALSSPSIPFQPLEIQYENQFDPVSPDSIAEFLPKENSSSTESRQKKKRELQVGHVEGHSQKRTFEPPSPLSCRVAELHSTENVRQGQSKAGHGVQKAKSRPPIEFFSVLFFF
jgi:hypothetical protein